jgi:hypothetical protein
MIRMPRILHLVFSDSVLLEDGGSDIATSGMLSFDFLIGVMET